MKRWTSLVVALMLAWPMSGLAWGRGGGLSGGGMRGSGTCLGTQQRQRLRDGSCLNTGPRRPRSRSASRAGSRPATGIGTATVTGSATATGPIPTTKPLAGAGGGRGSRWPPAPSRRPAWLTAGRPRAYFPAGAGPTSSPTRHTGTLWGWRSPGMGGRRGTFGVGHRVRSS